MAHEVDIHIGRKIREARLLTNSPGGGLMTQTELGDAVGVSFQQVQILPDRLAVKPLEPVALNRVAMFFFDKYPILKPVAFLPDQRKMPTGDSLAEFEKSSNIC